MNQPNSTCSVPGCGRPATILLNEGVPYCGRHAAEQFDKERPKK